MCRLFFLPIPKRNRTPSCEFLACFVKWNNLSSSYFSNTWYSQCIKGPWYMCYIAEVGTLRWTIRDIFIHIKSFTKHKQNSNFLYSKLHSRKCHIWSVRGTVQSWVSYMKFTHLFDQFSCVKLPIWNLPLFVIKSYRYVCMKMSCMVNRSTYWKMETGSGNVL